MQKKPTFLRNFLSFNQWRKRFNASKVYSTGENQIDFNHMKINLMPRGDAIQTRGHSKDLPSHIVNLGVEFSGKAELVFHHAKLIVLIRRGYKVEEIFSEFENLWLQEGDWLLKNLNIRWLVSACDTFADHSPDPTERSLAFSTSLLVNTLKLYETENYLTNSQRQVYDTKNIETTQRQLVPIFEGLSCFTIGTDDTLRNMVWRMKEICRDYVCGDILLEVFNRLQFEETAYSRIRKLHMRDKTSWW